MGNPSNGNRFNDDFKKMIVDLYQSGTLVKDLSSEYGVSETTIYKWVKKLKPIELADGKSITQDDYVKLQKELNRIKEENEILKKAMAIFAKK
ncbi:mobile element protein [Sporolactobacillus inulinus]|uniref:Mobile element protein n=1 Tax=Sporolactobacillus inulinus TaxID=2078 RepID=A0A4Y1ZHQ8_9BACL|nr:mobile element protein [Sporolactobacillus inulinus]